MAKSAKVKSKKKAKLKGKKKLIKAKKTQKKKVALKGKTKKKTKLKNKTTKKKTIKKIAKSKKKASSASKTVINSGLTLRDRVPNFDFEATNGQFKMSDFKGQKVVLYFYPKDNTSGCTLEGHDFTKLQEDFKKKNAVIFGISRDSIKSHNGFIEKQSYKHPLISDANEKICNLFGVIKEKSMYGRKYLGVDRSTFVIDEDGIIVGEWRNVKVPGHAEEVLNKI